MPKFHKQTVKQRFIASLKNCSTTLCSKVITSVLKLILSTLRAKDDKNILETGVRRFFVINGYEEVAEMLPKIRGFTHNTDPLYTGDFSTMYTTIPHTDLTRKIYTCIDEALSFTATERAIPVNNLLFTVVGDRNDHFDCTFTEIKRNQSTGHDKRHNSWTLSCTVVKALTRWLIINTYILNGDVIRRQIVGIPMGTNCAPLLANLYLYAYESAYIDTLDEATARHFQFTFRLIDDVLSVNNPHFHDALLNGLYPAALSLNDTSVSPTRVHFVGMSIHCTNNRLLVDIFDKRSEFPFNVIRYPHLDSAIPVHLPYGTFTGGLVRLYTMINDSDTFVNRCVELATLLRSKGCTLHRLVKCFRACLVKRQPLRWGRYTVNALVRMFHILLRG
jgi:hypothetical protein